MKTNKYFEFSNRVKIVSGLKVLEDISKELKLLNSKKPMILASRTIAKSGLIDIMKQGFKKSITIGYLETEIPPDSDLNIVTTLAKKYIEYGCDSIISMGGGSVIDTAKGVNIAVSVDCPDYDITNFCGVGIIKHKLKPLIVIPTTSGSGSEVTQVAVIADTKNNKKLLFTSEFLVPDVAILDPRVTISLPPSLTSQTGMDALTHACEAIISTGSNCITSSIALEAIKLISKNIIKVVTEPNNCEARLNMAIGSTLAGIAFSNSMVGIVHTLGHTVGAIAHVPHGVCMSILLPYGLEYNKHKRVEELEFMATGFFDEEDIEEDCASQIINKIKSLNEQLSKLTNFAHATSFKNYKDKTGKVLVKKTLLRKIADEAVNDGSILYNAEEMDRDEAFEVISAAYEGRELNHDLLKKNHQK